MDEGSTLLHEALHVVAVRCPEVSAHVEQVHDRAAPALVAAAEDAELLVLGARGDGGFDGLRVGSVALQVAAKAGCPTVVLPADPADSVPREQVVVGVDARSPAEAALDFAFAAARRYGVPLRALHTWPPLPGTGSQSSGLDELRAHEADLLASSLTPWKAAYPQVRVIEDAEPAGAGGLLVEASAKARLVVIGRRRPSARSGLGPVAHAVLHHASCPVAVVPDS